MDKICVIMDKWKGSLTAAEALLAAREGIVAALGDAAARWSINCIFCPDGGEGTAALLPIGGKSVECVTHDPLMRPVKACYFYNADSCTAALDIAAAGGLTLLGEEERNPMLTTTFGAGEMIADAIGRGAHHILLCLGGSATNDCGIGILAALGARFSDYDGLELSPCGGNLIKVASVETSALAAYCDVEFTLLCDVTGPLCGPTGAARMFARQKGADDAAIDALERGARHFAHVAGSDALVEAPSAGAAGGTAFGLMAFLGAKATLGSEAMFDLLHVDEAIASSRLVITGEGSIDSQSLQGKVTGEVMRRCNTHKVPVIGVAGRVIDAEELRKAGFGEVISVNECYTDTATEAMRPTVAAARLADTCRRVVTKHLC